MSTLTKKILFTTKSFLRYNFMVVENEQKAFIRVIIASLSKKATKKKASKNKAPKKKATKKKAAKKKARRR